MEAPMRTRSRTARAAIVAAVTGALVMGLSGPAPAKKRPRPPAPAPTVVPIPGGFCGYWGPNYSYTFPDGTVIRCS